MPAFRAPPPEEELLLRYLRRSLCRRESPCRLSYSVEEFPDGGRHAAPGRVDNAIRGEISRRLESFFSCFLRFRCEWTSLITYIQRVSPSEYGQTPPLSIHGSYTVKGEHGGRIFPANEDALRELERIGFLHTLSIVPGESVSFRFRDLNTRAWLRDVGGALELYVYKVCTGDGYLRGCDQQCRRPCWDDVLGHGSVSNEIDVMAARGVIPLFIAARSAISRPKRSIELAILRDRFSRKGAKAVIVSTSHCNAAARHRAAQLASL